MKIGLIGLGGFARHAIIPGIQMAPGLELAAVYDQSAAAMGEVAAHLPTGTACNSAVDLIQRSDLDLVYIATPSRAHRELVEQVIAAQRHVVCEKPFSMGYRDAAHLTDLAAKAGLVNAVDHEMRYSAIYQGLRQRIQEGYVGNVVSVAMTFAADYSVNPNWVPTYYWNFGGLIDHAGGILRQHVSHFIDLFFFLFGSIEPAGGYCATMLKEKPLLVETVSPAGERVFSAGAMKPVDADDTVALAGRLPNGAPAAISATWSSPVRTGTRWLIQGDRGVLCYQSGGEMMGLWGETLQGAQVGEDLADLSLPPDCFANLSRLAPDYMASLVGAELLDVAAAIDGRGARDFSTFASECEVWRAIEGWSA